MKKSFVWIPAVIAICTLATVHAYAEQVLNGGSPVSAIDIRQALAKLLQEKTGKPCTYVDVDGREKEAYER